TTPRKPAPARAATPDPWAALLRPTTHVPTPTTAAITAADLRTRLFIFAADSMGGRFLGTPGNFMGVEYIASEVKRFGLLPAGQDGTFFQTVPVDQRVFDNESRLSVDGTTLVPWTDYIPRDPGVAVRSLNGVQVIWGGVWSDSNSVITDDAARGKLVVLTSTVRVQGNPAGIPSRPEVANRFRSAAGIAVIGLESFGPEDIAAFHAEGVPMLRRAAQPGADAPAYLYVTRRVGSLLLGADPASLTPATTGKTVAGTINYQMKPYGEKPARNVVALLPGSDPVLRNEYVVIGAHNDHIGTQPVPEAHDSVYVVNHLFRKGGADDPTPQLNAEQQQQVNQILAGVRKRSGGKSARPDSIYNGADDDGSGSMSLLEIAQYLAAQPVKPKRSILFVWHVGEELGLFGSEWFTDHPTVPRDSLVAELNLDMVGRGAATDQTGNSKDGRKLHGGPGYLQVVGSRRLSTELGDLVEAVNRNGHHRLVFDYSMDANGHPQDIYCRSDHAEYARYGIPIAFFTTGGHADYHQLTDEPQYIDYNKMAQVDNFVADLARHVANLDHRVVVDKPKPDPHGACVQ
ncbi:MAG: M28 family metallopeptidase, partial [Gemmatimonadales bacterium]